jgi:hypothetical protein
VPLSVAVPATACIQGTQPTELDVLGVIRDEQGRTVGRMRETLKVAPDAGGAPKPVLYQSGLSLPPGRFSAKVVVRENAGGTMGSFETGRLRARSPRRPAEGEFHHAQHPAAPGRGGTRSESPLLRDGVEILPSLSHTVDRNQKLYFYYEVYDPETPQGAGAVDQDEPRLLSRRREGVRDAARRARRLDVAARRAAVFQFEVPAAEFQPGLYTCQVNIIDDVAARFAFPRLAVYVRP